MDTGVLVSAFAFKGTPAKAITKAFREADICVSPALLQEYRQTPIKLEAQKKITHKQMQALIAGIAAVVSRAKIVYPAEGLSLSRDPKDNVVLECCHAAKAGILITGDNDLLDIADLSFDLRIVRPQTFIQD
ncbi:MAG: putative toxin-antitoxin system toxin component, PIN family [Candidatus Methylomirabilota bacterium]|nr:putative toxin-antitoxin system toxin component, PIN family [Candidatus Methylomirabilis sp.]NJD67093.1 putative toxin-antitoxin system toxin component, PIN family [candidate division NC10 bacterium]PWB46024.1 MAG: putative toxin-antitoxin system toxin component, PIN family [candidate division NC10 bacterium]